MESNNKAYTRLLAAFSLAVVSFAALQKNWFLVTYCLVNYTIFAVFSKLMRKPYSYQNNTVPETDDGKFTKVVKNDIKFENVAGIEEIKEEIEEVADFLKNPEKYQKFGARVPKGILFFGPPGTGKTMIARALANETEASFLYASGSEFIEKFVGVGASRIRAIFEKAHKRSPCIIFLDEIDAIGVSRNTDNNSERDQTLNQLLVELDGFNQNEGVVVIAATNRLDMLDAALLRPGRFDRHIYIGNPCMAAREKILKVHLKGKPTTKTVDVKKLAGKTSGLSGAHLENITNEAALIAIKKNKKAISQDELDEAIIKISAGLKNPNMALCEKEKLSIAAHESGHTIAECIFNKTVPDRVTIIPHGQALGFMLADGSNEDKMLIGKEELENKICVLLAGRASEELEFDELTTGAQNDLQKANELAGLMVCEYGMSRYKNRVFNRQTDAYMSKEINEEITGILDICYSRVMQALKENSEVLKRLSKKLFESEILKKSEIAKLTAELFTAALEEN